MPHAAPHELSAQSSTDPRTLAMLEALQRKVLWLASWTIHHANHLRDSRDGLKVGGHQASSASMVSVMTALYFSVLRPWDRIAVKPHAAPVLHAIEYMAGRQGLDKLQSFRAFGGAQSYPSITKDAVRVDFSTGSVGLGVAATMFASMVQDYVRGHELVDTDKPAGRMIALVGDAEMDEGNVFEALMEGWKHDIRNTWWIIDYNRQSLDGVVNDTLFRKIEGFFTAVGWEVVPIKYGKKLQHAFASEAVGGALQRWIDDCPNQLYAALTFKGGAAWRERLGRDLAGSQGLKSFLDGHNDESLADLMTNLGGHDVAELLDVFHGVTDDRPRCFIAYTVKGFGLPLAGHKDNHAGLMTKAQMETFRAQMQVPDGAAWEPFAGLPGKAEDYRAFIASTPFFAGHEALGKPEVIAVPALTKPEGGERMSTQEGFGKILNDIARAGGSLAERIVTTSPDVTVSTSLGAWVNQRGIFHRERRTDTFREEKVVSVQKWDMAPKGQHIELGIAEHNLFLLLSELGKADKLFGTKLLPVGTLYDPFINRGLDALNYGCYQGSRYMVVATPSGLTLAPEGGAHQSINTPLVGMAQPGMTYLEPAYVDELAVLMGWAFRHMQAEDGGCVYLRLSTRMIAQPRRTMDEPLAAQVERGAYWLKPPSAGADLAIVVVGALVPEALEAHEQVAEDVPGVGLLVVTSPDLLHRDWVRAVAARRNGDRHVRAPVEALLNALGPSAGLVTLVDGHPTTLSWIGAVGTKRVVPLGVQSFGQSGDLVDLYRHYGLDADAIVAACGEALVSGWR